MTIGHEYDVRGLRLLLGAAEGNPVSQGELARRLKVTSATVARWEQKKMKPRPDMIAAMERMRRSGEGNAAAA